ncbi:MFS transporter, partial [Saccharothrix sp. MB29]|nr:MFS transporter [Saccharothrix sp. MB29]
HGGSMVHEASEAARFPDYPMVDYAAAKTAALSVSKSLAAEFGRHGVRSNVISPGPTRTWLWDRPGGFAEKLAERFGLPVEEAVEHFVRDVRGLPTGRVGDAEEVAKVIAYLLSPLARQVTGAGGRSTAARCARSDHLPTGPARRDLAVVVDRRPEPHVGGTAMSAALIALAMGAFGIGTTEFVIVGLLPEVALDLGVSIPDAGLLVSGYALSVVVGAPLMTALGSRLPRKTVLLALMGVFVLGNVLCAVADNYALLMVGRAVAALCHGAFFGIGSVVAASLVRPERQAGAIALLFSGLTLANSPRRPPVGRGWRGTRAATP